MKNSSATSILQLDSYQGCLKHFVQENRQQTGYQNRLAKAAGCQASYISRAIHGKVHLTPDQGYGIAKFWRLSETEFQYFMTLIQMERAGNPHLRRDLLIQLEELRKKAKDFSLQLKKKTIEKTAEKEFYYQAWYISAIHILTSIKEFQTVETISKRLGLDENLVQETLQKLVEIGFVEQKKDTWQMLPKFIHLSKGSIFTRLHHINWRNVAHQKLSNGNKKQMNFTSVASLSKKDMQLIEDILRKSIMRFEESVKDSEEETLIALNIDFFEV